MSDEPTLLSRLREAVKNAAAIGLYNLNTIALIREAADEIEERDKLDSMQWDADMRGVAMWRAANPGNDLVLPDRADFTAWLLGRVASQAVDIDNLTRLARTSLRRGMALILAERQFESYARNHRAKGTPDSILKAKVNEAMVEVCRKGLVGFTEMTAGDLGGVEVDGALRYPADPANDRHCLTCSWRSLCRDHGECRREVMAERAAIQ